MKTIKTFFVSFAFLCLGFIPISAMGQSLPHTFTANTAAKASEVNANFQYLLERFGTRRTTVNCYSGESITTALQNYNHIVISGICSEILHLEATSLPHRLVILEGSSSSSDGINANGVSPPQTDSSYTSNAVVYAHGSITIKISRLKLTGGTRGVESWLGPAVIIENALIENNTTHGIALWGNSSGWIKNSTIQNNSEHAIITGWSSYVEIDGNTISGHTNQSSIQITRSGSAWIKDNTITNGKHAGISIDRGASADIISNTIQSAENGISVQDSSHALLKSNTVKNNSRNGLVVENNASVILAAGNTFSNNTEYGINMYNGGSLNMWCDAQLTSPTTISGNTKGPIRVDEGGPAYLSNLTLASQSKGIIIQNGNFVKLDNVTITGSGEYGINVWGTNIGLEDSTISGSTNAEIFAKFSTINLEKTAITGTVGSDEIELNYGSMLFIGTGTTITGTVKCDGSVDNNSIDNWTNLTLTTSGC
jgi:parallel beta-helix repeat protein